MLYNDVSLSHNLQVICNVEGVMGREDNVEVLLTKNSPSLTGKIRGPPSVTVKNKLEKKRNTD